MLKTLGALNSFARTVISLGFLGLMSAGAFVGYEFWNGRHRAERELIQIKEQLKASEAEVRAVKQQLAESEAMRRLLKVDERVAIIDVLEQEKSKESGLLTTRFEFTELNEQGDPLHQPRAFTVEGEEVWLDALVMKFKDEFVERGDPLRGKTIFWFQKVFGLVEGRPVSSWLLDLPGAPLPAYRGDGQSSDFERDIWKNFWTYANDPKKLEQISARSAHGQANHRPVKAGMRYRIQLRASDGLSFDVEGPIPAKDKPAGPVAPLPEPRPS